MRMTATELRNKLYTVLDQVVETGEPVEILRKGRTLRITVQEEKPRTFDESLIVPPAKKAIIGDPDDLVHIDWSSEWKPFDGLDE
jgi:prevent-host-death family protein